MNKLVRNLFVFILIIVFITGFSSSYFSLNIDNLAYVLAIGIDKSNDDILEVSFQFSTTTPSTESGTVEKTPSVLDTVKASSLNSAITLMNDYMGKELNLSHCKVIIFSEELAYEGISNEIYTLINNTQIRPSANIIVSKCSAKEYINSTSPELENLISKYYEILTNSSKYIGLKPDSTIGDLFNSLICESCEPSAILGGLTTEGNDANLSSKDYSTMKSNESTIQGENGSENLGVAVFKSDKLVGELNAIETTSFLNMTNNINRFFVSIPDPNNPNELLDIALTPQSSNKIDIDTSSSSPYIKIKFKFVGRIYSMSENSEYLNSEVLDSISQACNSYLESTFTNYLYMTSKNFKSDINGFGKYALRNFFTTQEFENYNWLENYKDAFFDVSVDTYVKSGMLITGT